MSGLWDWALEAYARPGAQEALLSLQDEHGVNIPYLLWALWAAQGPGLTPQACGEAAVLARAWEMRVTGPLRAARRGLKLPLEGIDGDARLGLRGRIQHEELAAERLLLESLERLAPDAGQPGAVSEALWRAAQAWGGGEAAQGAILAVSRIF